MEFQRRTGHMAAYITVTAFKSVRRDLEITGITSFKGWPLVKITTRSADLMAELFMILGPAVELISCDWITSAPLLVLECFGGAHILPGKLLSNLRYTDRNVPSTWGIFIPNFL